MRGNRLRTSRLVGNFQANFWLFDLSRSVLIYQDVYLMDALFDYHDQEFALLKRSMIRSLTRVAISMSLQTESRIPLEDIRMPMRPFLPMRPSQRRHPLSLPHQRSLSGSTGQPSVDSCDGREDIAIDLPALPNFLGTDFNHSPCWRPSICQCAAADGECYAGPEGRKYGCPWRLETDELTLG